MLRKRASFRKAYEHYLGAAVAGGAVDPGKEFWRANADGEGEALLLKARYDAARGQG